MNLEKATCFATIISPFIAILAWLIKPEFVFNHWKWIALSILILNELYLRIKSKKKKIHEIGFDYLPFQLWERGWTWGYAVPIHLPQCSPANNSPVEGCLEVRQHGIYALDYIVPDEIGDITKHIEFSAIFNAQDNTMFFTEVELATKDESRRITGWIKHYKGISSPYFQEQYNEWTRFMQGRNLRNDWTKYKICLSKAVKETWGTKGWQFKKIKKIRIRGDISISPIEFY